jgi:hypothetical protein
MFAVSIYLEFCVLNQYAPFFLLTGDLGNFEHSTPFTEEVRLKDENSRELVTPCGFLGVFWCLILSKC